MSQMNTKLYCRPHAEPNATARAGVEDNVSDIIEETTGGGGVCTFPPTQVAL
jgi:hypothetical protein